MPYWGKYACVGGGRWYGESGISVVVGGTGIRKAAAAASILDLDGNCDGNCDGNDDGMVLVISIVMVMEW